MEDLKGLYNAVTVGQSAMVDEWFLMKTPLPTLAIVGLYLYFVLKVGPEMMEKRDAMKLKWTLVIYNGIQVVFSIWLCSQVFVYGHLTKHIFTMGCVYSIPRDDYSYKAMFSGAYWYYIAKLVELLDTVFFILRKKQNQVSFLHVYHHSAMVVWAFVYLKYLFGEQGLAIGIMNSFIHIIMYTYYMVAALGPAYQKYIWWKKYMTALQLFQFCVMILALVIGVAFDCNVPKSVSVILTFLVLSFLYLFARFYKQSYSKKGQPIKCAAATKFDENNNNEFKSEKLLLMAQEHIKIN